MDERSTKVARRDLLRSGIGLASGAAFLLAGRPLMGQAASDQALIDRAFQAQASQDYATAETIFRRLLRAGRTDEFIMRGLAWNLSRQWKHAEAIAASLDNNRRNPCAWSVAQVCEAYVNAGDYENGAKWLRFAKQNETAWGDARPAFESAIEVVAAKTFVVEYTLDPAVLANIAFLPKGDFLCPLPIPDLPYQTSSYEVEGALSTREETRAGNLCLRVTPDGGRRATVRCTVRLKPMSYRSRVRDFSLTDIPSSVAPLARSTRNVEIEHPTVKALAAELKATSAITTIENICAWDHSNLKFDPRADGATLGGGSVAALKRKTGHCEGVTSGAVALLRACGVPARFVRGYGAVAGASGTPTMHTWTEFYVPGAGWIQWDGENAPFAVPAKICIGCFRYTSPYAAPGSGDAETRDLWNFEAVLFPPGTAVGRSGNVRFRRVSMEL